MRELLKSLVLTCLGHLLTGHIKVYGIHCWLEFVSKIVIFSFLKTYSNTNMCIFTLPSLLGLNNMYG